MPEPSFYSFFDLVVVSPIPLPELGRPICADACADRKRIALAVTDSYSLDTTDGAHCRSHNEPASTENQKSEWIHCPPHPGETAPLEHARRNDAHLLKFPEIADFLVDPMHLTVRCNPHPQADPSSIRHILLDHVLPRFVNHLGRLVLHASAILHEHEAIAFVGRSGWGKSTLAASFAHDGNPGFGDDSLLLEIDRNSRVQAITSYLGARLWPDAIAALFEPATITLDVAEYTNKKRVLVADDPRADELRVPLRALFVLNDPEESPSTAIHIRPLRGTAALLPLVESSFLMDAGDLTAVGEQIRMANDVLRTGTPVSSLAYPRVHDELAHVRLEILQYLSHPNSTRGLHVPHQRI